jgi:hypothetical protein
MIAINYTQEETDATGLPAMIACQVACGSGCALRHDDCASQPCQNGGTCVDGETHAITDRFPEIAL